MEDINIKINRENRTVIANKYCIGNDGENLQGNIVFSFDEFVNGQARLEYVIKGAKAYQMLIKENETYKIPIKKVLTKEGTIDMQLVITVGTDETETSVFKSNIFSMFCDRSINSEIEQPDEYLTWIEVANTKLNEIDEALSEITEMKDYATEQANYAKETSDTLNLKLEKGELDGATFVPNLDEEGNLSWSNNKNLENPQVQNIRGPQGVMGPQGEAFKIKKTYSSKDEMLADFENMEVGDYVMITSNIEVEDNAKLYSKGETEWVFITDFSGATGIQGPQGPQGIQGIQGIQGPKGDKPVKYVDYFTEAEQNEMVAEITDNANSVFNQNVIEKTNEFNENAEAKVNEFNETVDGLQEEIDDLYNNQLFSEASGESIHITDSANAKVDYLEIEGNSYQETTSGKNLVKPRDISQLGYGGITCKTNSDGSFTFSGITTETVGIIIADLDKAPIVLKDGKTYTQKLFLISGGGNFSIVPFVENEDGTISYNYFTSSISSPVETKKAVGDKTVKGYNFYCQANNTIDATFKIQLEEGEVATEYEPYTGGIASPNPDYPQEVEVVEAYNLIPFTYQTKTINGVTFAANEDGTITVNGTATANTYFNLGKPTLQKGDYILTGLPRDGHSSTFKMTFKFEDVQQHLFGTEGKIFTINNEATAQEYYIYIASGYKAENLVFKPMIARGSKVRPYVPFGRIGIKTMGKNKLSQNNVEFTVFKELYIEPISAGTYKISGNITSTDTDANLCLLSFRSKEGTEVAKLNVNRGDFSNTLTLPSEINKINIYASTGYNSSVGDTAIFKDLMISKDGGEYEPYKEKIYYIDLQGNFVGKLPNGTKDKLNIQNNHLYLEKKIGKVVLDGSEGTFTMPSDSQFNIDNLITDYYKNYIVINYIIDYYQAVSQTSSNSEFQTESADYNYCFNFSSVTYTLRFKNVDITNVDDFKQWLSENNVTVYYELAEPQIIDLGYIKTPKTLEKTSNISLLANLETNMSLKYVQHTRTILDNIQNQINNIMTSIIPESGEVE